MYTLNRLLSAFVGVGEVNDDKLSLEEALSDKMRVQFHHDHLAFLHLAIK